MRTTIKSQMSSKFSQIHPWSAELNPICYNGDNSVNMFSLLSVIRFFSYLQETRIGTRAWMSLKFSGIRPGAAELAALEHLNLYRDNVV